PRARRPLRPEAAAAVVLAAEGPRCGVGRRARPAPGPPPGARDDTRREARAHRRSRFHGAAPFRGVQFMASVPRFRNTSLPPFTYLLHTGKAPIPGALVLVPPLTPRPRPGQDCGASASEASARTASSASRPRRHGKRRSTVMFRDLVTSVEGLRAIIGGEPSEVARRKELSALDVHARAFIARSPFLLLGTCSADGLCDVSPKGDAPGFVRVLDDHHLAIPDRPGNKRLDGMRN